ncbi:MAG: hypothetical protein HYU86_00930 [Chloroflexi bacterium]|nr:hypothetical protein [Chloroflexota bacterium]
MIDRYLSAATDMGISWVVLLASPNVVEKRGEEAGNTYLISALLARNMEPVVRVLLPVGTTDMAAFARYVRYYRSLGVNYFQIFNEPNRSHEWQKPEALSPRRYMDYWLPLASLVTYYGGYPGLGALDPQSQEFGDFAFLKETLLELQTRGRADILTRTWVGLHNYTSGTPQDYTSDTQGFARFEAYHQIVTDILGFALPILGTEGVLSSHDPRWREDTKGASRLQALWVGQGYRFMATAPTYLFTFSPWLIGNRVGGGRDSQWEPGTFFASGRGPQPVVEAVGRPAYLLRDSKRYWLTSQSTLRLLGYDSLTGIPMTEKELIALSEGEPIPPLEEGGLIKGSSDPIYIIQEGRLRWVPDGETFDALSLDWDAVSILPDWALACIPRANSLPSVTAHPRADASWLLTATFMGGNSVTNSGCGGTLVLKD